MKRLACLFAITYLLLLATVAPAADIWATDSGGNVAKFGPGRGNALFATLGSGQPAFDSDGNVHVFVNDTLKAYDPTGAEVGSIQLDAHYGMLAIDANDNFYRKVSR